MAKRTILSLNGRVTRDDGIFVVVINGPNWTTYADALDQVLNDTPQMVMDTLKGYAAKGKLMDFLGEFGVQPDAEFLDIKITLDLSQIVPSSLNMAESVTFPLRQAA